MADTDERSLEYLDAVLSTKELAALQGVSEDTIHRNHRLGLGPPRIQLSRRRYGFRRRDVLEWQRGRTSPAAA